ncbi:MAG: hypothetical protein IK149_08020 [Oscillospiraceae bacterium]|nr:hypothetical protein [Oscillospiraceae bacterium]
MNAIYKKAVSVPIMIWLALALSGCGLREQAREVDQLLVVQAMGVDAAASGVRLTLSSAAGSESGSPPMRLEGSGTGVVEAIERIRAGANEEDLLCAHIGHLLIGEETARRGIGPCLDYLCRTGDLRLSVPICVLRGGEAREALLGVGNESYGASDALESVDGDLRARGDGRSTPAAGILRDLARYGSALVCAVSLEPSAEADASAGAEERPLTLVPSGYAVLKSGKLLGFLDREQAVGVGLLLGESGLCEIAVTDQAGLPVTLTLSGGSGALEPRFDESGALRGLAVTVEAEALLAEGAAGDTEPEYLQRMLERALEARVREVLRLSQRWDADFLGLAGRLSLRAPGLREEDFAALWPELPLTVGVSAVLRGGGGLEEGA